MDRARGAIITFLLLFNIPSAAAGVSVCVSHSSHPEPVCQDIPLGSWRLFHIDDQHFQVELGVTGGVYCSGADDCGSTNCQIGEATAWWVRPRPITANVDWWQVEVELPDELCSCSPVSGLPCVPPGCEVLSRCGDETLTMLMEDSEQHTVHFAMLGAAPVANRSTSLPLHAVVTDFGPCGIPNPCDPGPPTVEVPQLTAIAAYLLACGYDAISAVQTAFDWGEWTFLNGIWNCQGSQLSLHIPGHPGGPLHGTLQTTFDCLSGGTTRVIGRMHLMTSFSGCLEQVESSMPFGTHVVDCATMQTAPVLPPQRGSICVDSQGVNACPSPIPIEATSWGRIKGSYR